MEDTVSCGFICLLRLRGGRYFPSENGKTWNQVKLVLFKELERVFPPCWWPPALFFPLCFLGESSSSLLFFVMRFCILEGVAKFLFLKISVKDFVKYLLSGLGKVPQAQWLSAHMALCLRLKYYGGGGLVAQSCLTLAAPWTVARQAPLSMGFPLQEYWDGLSFPSAGDLPDPGIEPTSPASQAVSCVAGGFFTDWAIWTLRKILTVHFNANRWDRLDDGYKSDFKGRFFEV